MCSERQTRFERAQNAIYTEFDSMTNTELANLVANPGSENNRTLILYYFTTNSKRQERRKRVKSLLDKNNDLSGALLEED